MNQISPALPPVMPRHRAQTLEALCKEGIAAGAVQNAASLMRLEHAFIPGAYARSLWRPAGTLIVGKIHKHPCFTFLASGRLTVWSEDGVKELTPGSFFVSEPGAKRVTFAHEDSLLITVYGTNETDLDRLEAELIEPEQPCELPEAVKIFLAKSGVVA